MRSIWGQRVDRWFDSKTGAAGSGEPKDYNALGVQLLGILAVVVFVGVLVIALNGDF